MIFLASKTPHAHRHTRTRSQNSLLPFNILENTMWESCANCDSMWHDSRNFLWLSSQRAFNLRKDLIRSHLYQVQCIHLFIAWIKWSASDRIKLKLYRQTHVVDNKTIGMLFANPNNRPKNRIQLYAILGALFGVVQIVRDDVKGLRSLLSAFLYVCLCVWVQNVHRWFVKTRVEISIWNGKRARMQTTKSYQTLKYAQLFWIRFRFVFISLFCVRITIHLPLLPLLLLRRRRLRRCKFASWKHWHCSRI